MQRPLDDILVVSVEQAIAAPFCTRQLADLGARVIKVERLQGGDFARDYDSRARGMSSHFVWTNRSKESVQLDLKSGDGVAALRALIGNADVFVQNLAPGAMTRMGLDHADLRKENPRLITCNISGYGPDGPCSDRKAYDLLVQAEAGFLSITGDRESVAKAGISVADIAAGTMAHQGILASLLQRAKTGEGAHLEITMLEALAEWMGFPMYYALDGASPPARAGARHATIYPYGPYDTLDGTVLFGLQNDREWDRFATIVLKRPDWAHNADFKSNSGRFGHKDVIEPVIVASLGNLETQSAISLLDEAGIATAHLNQMSDLWEHPQLLARNVWTTVETPVGPMPALWPSAGSSWSPRMDPVPDAGEHTDAVLAEFGISPIIADGED